MNENIIKFTLTRDYMTDKITLGTLVSEDGEFKCETIERPWEDNQVRVSCIPAGVYIGMPSIYYGGDGVGGKADYPCYELKNVPGRTLIKIHIGNYVRNFLGCIGLGSSRSENNDAVWSSKKAFDRFMDYCNSKNATAIEIEIIEI